MRSTGTSRGPARRSHTRWGSSRSASFAGRPRRRCGRGSTFASSMMSCSGMKRSRSTCWRTSRCSGSRNSGEPERRKIPEPRGKEARTNERRTESGGLGGPIALYLLKSTYGDADGYYSDALIENAVDAYGTVGFDGVWDAFTGYADDLQAEVDAKQAEADAHLAAASDAGRRASGFILSTVLMAVAVSISPVALASPLRALRLWDLAIITALYAIGGLNLAWTFPTYAADS